MNGTISELPAASTGLGWEKRSFESHDESMAYLRERSNRPKDLRYQALGARLEQLNPPAAATRACDLIGQTVVCAVKDGPEITGVCEKVVDDSEYIPATYFDAAKIIMRESPQTLLLVDIPAVENVYPAAGSGDEIGTHLQTAAEQQPIAA